MEIIDFLPIIKKDPIFAGHIHMFKDAKIKCDLVNIELQK
tara:strand:+ start:468 stop:587 length:120 start_codon:yes stop_codon:yes gene_type:complete